MFGFVRLDSISCHCVSLACHKVSESIETCPKTTWFFAFRRCDRMSHSLDVGCQGAGKDAGADSSGCACCR
jgi:hypothetical protein